MPNSYYAIRPKGDDYKTTIRIEKAGTVGQAAELAFGRGKGKLEAKNLGTRVSVIHSDKKRIALLTSEEGWIDVTGRRP
jgi:hypothetical protein